MSAVFFRGEIFISISLISVGTSGVSSPFIEYDGLDIIDTIKKRIFSYCLGLKSVTIPDTVTTIEEGDC